VKYYLMRWDMIQDGWIKVEVLSIVIEWSLVDNLVTSENKGNSTEISKKKKSHYLRHTIQYLTLVKTCLRFHDIIIWGCYSNTLLTTCKNITYEPIVVDMVVVSDKLSHPQRTFFRSFSCLFVVSFCFGIVVDCSWWAWTCLHFELNTGP